MGPLSILIDTAEGARGIAFFRKVKGRGAREGLEELGVLRVCKIVVYDVSGTVWGGARGGPARLGWRSGSRKGF